MSDKKKVRVRIAVVVDEEGNWMAYSSRGMSDDEKKQQATEFFEPEGMEHRGRCADPASS